MSITVGNSSDPKKCTRCMRTTESAIKDCITDGRVCSDPECPLRDILEEALEEYRSKPKLAIGATQKPEIKVGETVKPEIKIGETKKISKLKINK